MMTENVDLAELEKFSQLAHKWWDQNSEFRPLHDLNPLRLEYIDQYARIKDKIVLDVGCGGGILSESMALGGAKVTGIDLAKKSLKVAQLHSLETGVEIDYRSVSVETLAEESPQCFDVVTCMEMLEHVPDPQSVLTAVSRLVKPGGWVFFSTLNRNPKSYVMAVLGAEYVLGLLPRGTHDYERFIKPSELTRMARNAGLNVMDIRGVHYQPFTRETTLSDDCSINYMMALQAER